MKKLEERIKPLQELRELIIKTNYNKESIKCGSIPFKSDITLAEVLIAIKNWDNLSLVRDYLILIRCDIEPIVWDLTKDLDNQSPETIKKLLELLK